MRKILSLLAGLLLLPMVAAAQGQVPGSGPISPSQVTLPLLNPPVAVTSGSVQLVGNPGPNTLYLWIVAKYVIGNANPAGPFVLQNAPITLSSSNYAQLTWQPVAGALSYDILMTSTATQPSGSCGCAVATSQPPSSYNVQSSSLSGYTVTSTDANNFAITQQVIQSATPNVSLLEWILNNGFVLATLDSTGNFTSASGASAGVTPGGQYQCTFYTNAGLNAIVGPDPNCTSTPTTQYFLHPNGVQAFSFNAVDPTHTGAITLGHSNGSAINANFVLSLSASFSTAGGGYGNFWPNADAAGCLTSPGGGTPSSPSQLTWGTCGSGLASVTNDTNVTGTLSGGGTILTLGWTGRLAKTRQLTTNVFTDQANTYSTGDQNFNAASSLEVPSVTSPPATLTVGSLYYRSDLGLYYGYNGLTDSLSNKVPLSFVAQSSLGNFRGYNMQYLPAQLARLELGTANTVAPVLILCDSQCGGFGQSVTTGIIPNAFTNTAGNGLQDIWGNAGVGLVGNSAHLGSVAYFNKMPTGATLLCDSTSTCISTNWNSCGRPHSSSATAGCTGGEAYGIDDTQASTTVQNSYQGWKCTSCTDIRGYVLVHTAGSTSVTPNIDGVDQTPFSSAGATALHGYSAANLGLGTHYLYFKNTDSNSAHDLVVLNGFIFNRTVSGVLPLKAECGGQQTSEALSIGGTSNGSWLQTWINEIDTNLLNPWTGSNGLPISAIINLSMMTNDYEQSVPPVGVNSTFSYTSTLASAEATQVATDSVYADIAIVSSPDNGVAPPSTFTPRQYDLALDALAGNNGWAFYSIWRDTSPETSKASTVTRGANVYAADTIHLNDVGAQWEAERLTPWLSKYRIYSPVVNANVGTFGDSTHVGQFTVDGKGRITAAANVAVTAGYTWIPVAKTSNYNIATSDFSSPTTLGNWLFDQGVASATYTLPAAASAQGDCVMVSNIGTGTLTIDVVTNSVNINGDATNRTLKQYDWEQICYDTSTSYKGFGTLQPVPTGTGAPVRAASPALTGTPTAPTQTAGDNSTDIATDAFVTTAINNGVHLVFSDDQTGISLTAGTGALGGSVSMLTPGAVGTYEFRSYVVLTTAGSGGTCTTAGVSMQVAGTDADTGVAFSGVNNVTYQIGSGVTTATMGNPNLGSNNTLGTHWYALPWSFRSASGAAISYQLNQQTADNCTTVHVIAVHNELWYTGH